MAITDYVIMPGSDYQAVCDKIREKTGKTGIIKSGDLVTEIEENMGQIIENQPIELDFTGGNQTITAPEGYLVKSAILQKPADLLAENIAEGKNIGGIIGTLAAGGGSPVLIKTWTPSATTGNFTVFTAAELETIGFSTNKKCFTYIGPTGNIDPTRLHFLEAFAHNWYAGGTYGSYIAYFANLSSGAVPSNITSNCFPYAAGQYHSNCLSYRTSDKTIGIYANTLELYTHEYIVMVGCF